MPTLADSISMIKIGKVVFNNPDCLSSHLKLKKEPKNNALVANVMQKANFRNEYQVVTLENQPTADEYISTSLSKMDFDCSDVYAPWNPMFRKSKTLITFNEE